MGGNNGELVEKICTRRCIFFMGFACFSHQPLAFYRTGVYHAPHQRSDVTYYSYQCSNEIPMISSSNDHFRWVGSKSCMSFGNISDMDFRFVVIFVSFFFFPVLPFGSFLSNPTWAGHYLCAGSLGQEFLSRWKNVRPQLGRNKSSSGSWNQFQGRLLQDGQDRIGQDGLRHGPPMGHGCKHTVELTVLGGELVFCGVKRPDLIPSKV